MSVHRIGDGAHPVQMLDVDEVVAAIVARFALTSGQQERLRRDAVNVFDTPDAVVLPFPRRT